MYWKHANMRMQLFFRESILSIKNHGNWHDWKEDGKSTSSGLWKRKTIFWQAFESSCWYYRKKTTDSEGMRNSPERWWRNHQMAASGRKISQGFFFCFCMAEKSWPQSRIGNADKTRTMIYGLRVDDQSRAHLLPWIGIVGERLFIRNVFLIVRKRTYSISNLNSRRKCNHGRHKSMKKRGLCVNNPLFLP